MAANHGGVRTLLRHNIVNVPVAQFWEVYFVFPIGVLPLLNENEIYLGKLLP